MAHLFDPFTNGTASRQPFQQRKIPRPDLLSSVATYHALGQSPLEYYSSDAHHAQSSWASPNAEVTRDYCFPPSKGYSSRPSSQYLPSLSDSPGQINDFGVRSLPTTGLVTPARPSQPACIQPALHGLKTPVNQADNGFPFPLLTPPLTPPAAFQTSSPSSSYGLPETPRDEHMLSPHRPLPKLSKAAAAAAQELAVDESSQDSGSLPTLSSKMLDGYALDRRFRTEYTIVNELGSGGFGFVVKALRCRDGLPVAVKFIAKDRVLPRGWYDFPVPDGKGGTQMDRLPTEVFLLQKINHPGVVSFVDLFDDDDFFYLVSSHAYCESSLNSELIIH